MRTLEDCADKDACILTRTKKFQDNFIQEDSCVDDIDTNAYDRDSLPAHWICCPSVLYCSLCKCAQCWPVQCVLCWSGQGLVGPVSSFHCRGWPHPSTCLLPKPPCTLHYPCLRCPFSIGPFWFQFFIQSQCPKRAQIKGGFFNCPPPHPT